LAHYIECVESSPMSLLRFDVCCSMLLVEWHGKCVALGQSELCACKDDMDYPRVLEVSGTGKRQKNLHALMFRHTMRLRMALDIHLCNSHRLDSRMQASTERGGRLASKVAIANPAEYDPRCVSLFRKRNNPEEELGPRGGVGPSRSIKGPGPRRVALTKCNNTRASLTEQDQHERGGA